jgi:tetratricopeptide (TPR) repeat protein
MNAAIKLRKDDLRPHFHLAFLYARQSMDQKAIEECQYVLDRVPGDASVSILLSEMYVSMARFDDAIATLEKVIPGLERSLRRRDSEKSMLAEAYYRLATAYSGKGESRQADLYFQKSIDVYEEVLAEQGNTGTYYDIAMVYDAMGDFSLAEKYLRKHIELEPDEPNAYNFLGYMFVENNVNLEEAVDLIRIAVEDEPENGAFRDSLGWAYFKLGELDKAVEELEKAVQLIPEDSSIREHLGEVYLEKGGKFAKKAVLEWEKSLEIKPKNDSLQQRLEELCRSQEIKESVSEEN